MDKAKPLCMPKATKPTLSKNQITLIEDPHIYCVIVEAL